MNRLFLIFLIFLTTPNTCFSVEIVYPKKTPSTINASSTFFIGSTNPSDKLSINNTEVKVSKQGTFAQVVPLCIGKNSFNIKSTSQDQSQTNLDFVIERPTPSTKKYTEPNLLEYPPMEDFRVKTDGTPLRSTAVDGGINRMAHLSKDTLLTIDGEKNNFYRVFLNSTLYGWIDKNSVEKIEQEKLLNNQEYKEGLANLNCAKGQLTRDFYTYEFEFDKKIPFNIKEEIDPSSGITVEFFNTKGPNNTLSFNIPIQKITGYDGYWKNDKFILKARRTPSINVDEPIKNITIAVDAGHGGNESGAIGCGGTKEKDINLAISKFLATELDKRGARVLMTRKDDIDTSLSDRVNFAKENNATLLLSLHANALPDGLDPNKNRGTSVYYYHNQAKSLADSILKSMTTQLCTQNDKVRQGSLALVRPTASVSVLIEVAYMINPDDYALLTDEEFQKKCAKAIADGVEDYLKK